MKSPSKFLSLKFLLDLKENYYISKQNVEYCEYEVNRLILEKQAKFAEKCSTKLFRNGYSFDEQKAKNLVLELNKNRPK